MEAPPGPIDYSDRGSVVIWSMWMLVGVTALFVALRLYTRICIVKSMGADDWVLLVCCFINAGFAACCHLAVNAGMGRHMAALEPPEIIETLKLTTIAQSVGISVTGFAKLALGLFLLRIVAVPWHRLAIWIPMLIVGAGCVLVVVCLWLQKTPVEAVYNPFIPSKTNLDQTALSLVYSSLLIITDFYYAIFPWVFMWKLQMRYKEKVTIAGGLSLGVVAGCCGIVRTVKLENLASADFSWAIVDPIIWTAAEFCVTLICSSVIVLFPLYKKVFKISGSSNDYSNQLPDENSHSHHLNSRGFRSKNDFDAPYPLDSRNKSKRGVTTTEIIGDDSDDSILGSTKRNDLSGINRTYKVDVEYDDASTNNRH